MKDDTAFTLWPFIFTGKNPSDALLDHERVHIKQQQGAPGTWLMRYGLDKDFRWREEREAVTKQIQTRAFQNRPVDWEQLKNELQSYDMVSDLDLRIAILVWKAQYNAISGLLAGKRK